MDGGGGGGGAINLFSANFVRCQCRIQIVNQIPFPVANMCGQIPPSVTYIPFFSCLKKDKSQILTSSGPSVVT